MASFGDVFAAIGVGAGGLAEGIEAGFAINQRQQVIALQERQSNLQAIGAFADIMEPGVDPAIREMTMRQIMPQLGFDEQKGAQIIKDANRLDDENKASLTNFLKNHPAVTSGKFTLKMLLEEATERPLETMKFIQDWELSQKAEERAVKGDLRDDRRLELDEASTIANIEQGKAQTAISAANLKVSQGHLALAAQAAENAQLNGMIEHRREGMKAIENILKIPNAATRSLLLDKHNEDYGLFDDSQLTALKEAPLETSADVLAQLNIKLKALELYQKEQGGGLTVAERKGKMARRAAGELTKDMPPDIKALTPAQAKKELEGMSTSALTVSKAGLTKGQTGDMKIMVNDIDFGVDMGERLIGMIEKNPNIAGASGAVARGAQSLTGTVTSLSALAGEAKDAGIRLSTYIDDPELQAEIDSIMTDPKVQQAKVVEAVLRLAFAKQMTTAGRINREQYEVAADQINITGFSDAKHVLTKLREAVLTMKKKKIGIQDLIDQGQEGVATEQDFEDENTHDNLLNYLTGGEEEE